MAVEIPVIINIEQAFEDAAKRVSSAIQPMKHAIEKDVAKMRIDIFQDGSSMMSIKEILEEIDYTVEGVNYAFTRLRPAIDSMKESLNQMYARAAHDGRDLTKVEQERAERLREGIVLLEAEIDLRTRAGEQTEAAARRQIEVSHAIAAGNAAMEKEAKTASEMSQKITDLRGKLENIDISTKAGQKEWAETAKAIKKATAELDKYEKKLDKALGERGAKPGSVNRIKAEMQDVINQWNAMSAAVKFDKNGNLSSSAQKLIAKYRELTKQSELFGKSIDGYVQKGKAGNASLLSGLKKVGAAFGVYASAHQLVRFVKHVRDVTGELEYQRVALGHLIQDQEYGNRLFNQTIEAAKKSPFRISQLVTYTKQLAAYRIEQTSLFETTQRLADISAGLGVEMNRLILAYGQVRAASVLRGQELRQFTEAGIPLVELLADKLSELNGVTVTTGEVFKKISERAIPFSYIADIFEDLTDKGGMFYKMQEEQANTLKGRWEKLKDAYDQALMRVGENETFQRWNDMVLGFLTKIANNLPSIIRLLNAASIAWVTYWGIQKSGIVATIRLNGVIGTLKLGLVGLKRAVVGLAVALKANWPALLVGGVLGAITYLTTFKKKVEEVNGEINELNNAVDEMHSANSKHSRLDKIISSYESLVKMTERTEKQNEKLENTILRLKQEFPGLASAINGETDALDKNVAALRAENDALLEQERARKRQTLETDIKRLDEAKRERERLSRERTKAQLEYNDAKDALDAERRIGESGGLVSFLTGSKASQRQWEKIAKRAEKYLSEVEAQYEAADKKVSDLTIGVRNLNREINGESIEDITKGWDQWKKEVYILQEAKKDLSEAPVFTPEELGNIHSVYDLFGKLKKRFTDATQSLEGMRTQLDGMSEGTEAYQKLSGEIKDKEGLLAVIEAIRAMFGFNFAKSGEKAYEKDPFIDTVQNRIKYMKDYQRGLENLSQYLKSSDALSETERIMAARGDFLGIGKTARESGGQDLSKWYQDQIDEVVKKMKSKGVKGETAEDILRQKFLGKSNWAKMVRDFQALLQSLWDAKTDFDTSQMEKQFKQKMEDIKNNLARSSEATNFFRDIFNKTGNEDIATNITATIYGEDFNKSIKDNIMSTLLGARNAANLISDEMLEGDNGDLSKDELQKAVVTAETLKEKIEALDFTWLLKNINLFPKEWHSAIEQAAKDYENFNKEWLKRAAESYAKFSSIPERKKMVETQSNALLKAINDSDLDNKTKESLRNAVMTERAQDLSNLELEAIKRGDEWTKTFERLDRVSSDTLRSLIGQLDTWIEKSGPSASPEDLKAVTQARERARAQLIEYNGYEGLIDAAGRYAKALSRQHDLKKEGKNKGREYTDAMNAERDALVDMGLAINTINKNFDEMASAVSSVADILGLEDDSGAKAHFEGIAEAFKMIGSALAIVNAVLALMAMNPLVLSITAVIAGLTAIFTVASSTKVAAANRNIKEQQELLDSLSEAYEHLQDAAEKAFNSDYITNYQSRLANLQAQEAAYLAQAAAEREKGKKADEDQIKQYEKSAREAANAIAEMSEDLQQHFLGTDLTSAARDFASAWIDAYKEFGSTTDAIKEKFRDMITGMVTESLAAQVVQRQLKPIFDYIDGLSGDGVLSVSDAAEVANMTKQAVGSIDLGLTNLMNALSGAGINLRTMGTGLTGISKDIQNASEESILGLAAGVNTQNFYMSQINANVIRIVEMMGGEPRSGQAPGQSDTGAGPTYQDQMLQYARNLPQMASDMAQIRNLLDKVIVKGSNYSVRVS